jgi:hypothetical protein
MMFDMNNGGAFERWKNAYADECEAIKFTAEIAKAKGDWETMRVAAERMLALHEITQRYWVELQPFRLDAR